MSLHPGLGSSPTMSLLRPRFPKAPVQLMGHAPSLQVAVLVIAPHPMPPHEADSVIERVRMCSPPPHVLVHVPQLPQFDSTQFLGQHWWLHVRDSVMTGQLRPPHTLEGISTKRTRRWCPPAHESEHASQLPHSETMQSRIPEPSSGHGSHSCVLHGRSSESTGQAEPSLLGAVCTSRVLVRSPPSEPGMAHCKEQPPQLVQAETAQSMGQTCAKE